MIKLRFKDGASEDYPEDVDRIISVCNRLGYSLSRKDALLAWLEYSGFHAAGWMCLPKDDLELFGIVRMYTVVVKE